MNCKHAKADTYKSKKKLAGRSSNPPQPPDELAEHVDVNKRKVTHRKRKCREVEHLGNVGDRLVTRAVA
jgi:hypothetical protein